MIKQKDFNADSLLCVVEDFLTDIYNLPVHG